MAVSGILIVVLVKRHKTKKLAVNTLDNPFYQDTAGELIYGLLACVE